jgi:hypothetical protein
MAVAAGRPAMKSRETAGARNELRRLADEEAGLRRVATMVATGAQPDSVFHVGKFEVESRPGVGTRVAARLPLAE